MKIYYKSCPFFHLWTKYLRWQQKCLLSYLYAYFNIFGDSIFLATNQGVFRKDQTKGYLNMNKNPVLQMLICVQESLQLPQNSMFLK